jgi:signal transduction histidine kinase
MDSLRSFFILNREIIYFVYGLAFFLLGFAIALQLRRDSRLDLARSLTWLSAFGITHGLFEWGDLFIPIQANYLNPLAVRTLNIIHLVLLAVSFTLLFQFGMALLKSLGWAPWTGYLAAGLFVLWALVTFLILPSGFTEFTAWSNTSRALARYFISFPGSLLAAYGLREQTMRRIAPLNVPHIVNTLRVSGMALAVYAFVSGLVPPPAPFFPANVINTSTFFAAFGIPVLVFRTVIGFVLTLSIIRALEVFDLETERMIESMEQGQILAAERERIARDLHDGAIQKVYTAGLLVESTSKLINGNEAAANRLRKALEVLNDAISDLRRNLGKLKTEPARENLLAALQGVAADPRVSSLVNVSLDLNLPSADSFSPIRAAHVIAIVNESLSNVVRHAHARRVVISAHRVDDWLQILIRDDGVGLAREPNAGYGLRNMRDRARLLGGEININDASGRGTIVTLMIPWKDEH